MMSAVKDLLVWQKAVDLVVAVYECTKWFPKGERYGLTTQMRQSAIAIPSHIAEGRCRGTDNDYIQFLRSAYGRGAGLATHIEIAKRLKETNNVNFEIVEKQLHEVMKKLDALIHPLV